jgi:transcriptional regulator with XRE-family HTH domain
MASSDDLSSALAENLRRVRDRRGLTQGQLAKLCGVPRSTLAQIETGISNPTLSVLARLASALQLTLEELLSPPSARGQLYRRGSLPIISKGKDGRAVIHKLLPDPIPGMEIDRMELKQGARVTGVPHRSGTREYLACESGKLILWAAGERFELSPGDLIAFDGSEPHSYQCGDSASCVAFSVVVLAPLLRAGG